MDKRTYQSDEDTQIEIDYGDVVEGEKGFSSLTGQIAGGEFDIHLSGTTESLQDFVSGQHPGRLLSLEFEQVEMELVEKDQKEAQIRSSLYARLDTIRGRIDETHLPQLREPYLISFLDHELATPSRFEAGELTPELDRIIEIVPTFPLEKGCLYRLSYLFDPTVSFLRYDHWQAGVGALSVSAGFNVRGGSPIMWEYYSHYENRLKLVVYGASSPTNVYDINPSWILTGDDLG